MKTSELTGAALDWAVAKCLVADGFGGKEVRLMKYGPLFGKGYLWPTLGFTRVRASTDWSQGGPIIERLYGEGLELVKTDWPETANKFRASLDSPNKFLFGPTPLIAAMRCYVASKLGDEVAVPEALL
jgi:hypothetical protein